MAGWHLRLVRENMAADLPSITITYDTTNWQNVLYIPSIRVMHTFRVQSVQMVGVNLRHVLSNALDFIMGLSIIRN